MHKLWKRLLYVFVILSCVVLIFFIFFQMILLFPQLGVCSKQEFWNVLPGLVSVSFLVLIVIETVFIYRRNQHLKKLECELQKISPTNLKQVSIPSDRHIAVISLKLNELVMELHESIEREKQFTANVSHELKTPITEIITLSEVALKWGTDLGEEDRQNYQDVLVSARSMKRIVRKLLSLSRLDQSEIQIKSGKIDFTDLITEVWARYTDRAEERNIEYQLDVASDVTLKCDRDLIKRILANLISNAIDYSPVQSLVTIEINGQDDFFVLKISNLAEHLTDKDIKNVFNRFWRKDHARTSGSKHSGLGLPLVRALAAAMGMSVEAQLTKSNLFCVIIKRS